MKTNDSMKRKTFVTLVLISILLAFSSLHVSATTNKAVTPMSAESVTDSTNEAIEPNGQNSSSDVDASAGLQKTTVKEIQSKVNEKGFDVVHILQTVGKPLAVICFIVSAFVFMFSLIMKSNMMVRSGISMLISAAVYGLISVAPQIVQMISYWMQS